MLGNASVTSTSSSVPVPVTGVSGAIAVAVGEGHVCAVLADYAVVCWGRNNEGELGGGTTYTSSLTPVAIPGLSNVATLAAGEFHTCAVAFLSGAIKCWADHSYYQLVGDPGFATAIAAGSNHTCALLTGGSIHCWGDECTREWATALPGAPSNTYFTVLDSTGTPITGALGIAAGGLHSCAVMSDGTVDCWGDNPTDNTDGLPPDPDRLRPTAISGAGNAMSISSGQVHSCEVHPNGSMSCWGANDSGELGNGEMGYGDNSAVPVTGW